MFTPLITHDSDGTALAAPVDAARRNGATYKTRTIDDLRIKDDRLRAAIEGTGHLLFDGGMGTMLQAAGMKAGSLPELLNFEEPQVITDIQRQYVEAGCDVITANTFGANAHKLDGAATVADVFAAAVACAREAGARYVAGDIGPIGALLRPLGTLSFDEAYDLFAEEVRAGVAAGVPRGATQSGHAGLRTHRTNAPRSSRRFRALRRPHCGAKLDDGCAAGRPRRATPR